MKRERLTKSVIQTVEDDKEPSASPMSKSVNSDNLEGKQAAVKFLRTAEVVGIDKISDKKISKSPEKLSQSALSRPSSKSRGSSSPKLFSQRCSLSANIFQQNFAAFSELDFNCLMVMLVVCVV